MADLLIKDPSPEKTKAATKLHGDSLITDTVSAKAFLGPYITEDGQHAVFKLKKQEILLCQLWNGLPVFVEDSKGQLLLSRVLNRDKICI